jgi:excisionase family DNA binding protein
MKIERQTITVREAAKIIGCSHVLLYAEIKKGNFTQVIRIGRRLVVPMAALEKYLANAGASNAA